MAIIKCRECRKKVSSEASSCPHCGIESPNPPVSSIGEFFQGILGIIMIMFIIYSCSSESGGNGNHGEGGKQNNLELDETQLLLNELKYAKSNTECFNIYAKLHKLHGSEYLNERMECSKKFRVTNAKKSDSFAIICASATRDILNEQPYGWEVEVPFMPDMLIMDPVGKLNGRIIYNNIGTLYIKNAFNAKRKSKVSCVYNTIKGEIVYLKIGNTTYKSSD